MSNYISTGALPSSFTSMASLFSLTPKPAAPKAPEWVPIVPPPTKPIVLSTTQAAPATAAVAAGRQPTAIEKFVEARNKNPVLKVVYNPLVVAGVSAAAAYHGYKRRGDSISGALLYSFGAGLAPPFMVAIMLAQGFGKPKLRSNPGPRRRRRRRSRR